jgi:hypothetical protein
MSISAKDLVGRISAADPELLALFGEMSREDTPYFAAVGRFIVEYAAAEAAAHLLARHLSGLSDEKARIISAACG